MVPYKRHVSKTIEDCIDSKGSPVCEISTIYRTKRWFAVWVELFINSYRSLREAVVGAKPLFPPWDELRSRPGWLAKLVVGLVNFGYWGPTRSALSRSARGG